MEKQVKTKTLKGKMKRTTVMVAATTLFATFATDGAFGQQIADAIRVSRQGLHFNARALGLGNTYSTIGYDFSALRFNPATMGVIDKFSYTMTVNTNAFKTTSDYYGTNVGFTTSSTTGSQMGLTLPIRLDSTRSAVIGFGYTQSKDFNLGYKYEGLNSSSSLGEGFSFVQTLAEHDDPLARALGLSYPAYDSSGNYIGDRTVLGSNLYERGYLLDEGGMFHFSFGAAVEPVHNVFFGVSGSYNAGPYTSDLELSASDTNDVYPAGVQTIPGNSQTDGFVGTDYRVVRSKTYTGWDVRFGVLYKLENFIGLSAFFKIPTANRVDEDLFLSGKSRFAANRSIVVSETQSSSSYSFTPPAEMTLGGMVNLWILTATAEASYINYSDMKITSGVGELPDRTLINKRIKDELSAVVNLNAGVEFRLPWTGLSARAGAMYRPSPYKQDPSRFSQKFLTAGFGINSNNMMQFDIGYAYGWRGDETFRQTTDLQAASDSGAQETITYHSVLFTMRFSP